MADAVMEVVESVDPPLKWAGGKRWLVPQLRSLWERYSRLGGGEARRLVEPFCGGAAVTLGLKPERALLIDVNPHLINFYRQIQRSGTPFPDFVTFENDERHYYSSRDWFNELIRDEAGRDSDTAAALFYYLNKTGFNGLCRFNAKGGYNVPFGRYKTINYRRDFQAYRAAFSGWSFKCADFERVSWADNDFIYADPPYDVEFTTYSAGGFSWKDQERAATWLAQHPGPVVLSNQATPRIINLYTALGFDVELLSAPRRISCTGDRAPAREVLATRNLDREG